MKNIKVLLKYVTKAIVNPLVYVVIMPIIIVIGFIIGLMDGDIPEFMWYLLWADIGMIVLTTGIFIAKFLKEGA